MLEEQCDKDLQPPRDGETSHRAQIQQQRCCVEDLRQQILRGQIRAEKELEFHQARICQQIKDSKCPPLEVSASPNCSNFMFPQPSVFSFFCFLCDMMESWLLGVLSILLEMRGSYKGAGSMKKADFFMAPQSEEPPTHSFSLAHLPILFCPACAHCCAKA